MEQKNKSKTELQQVLDGYVSEGFQADTQRIKKDMCAQFADYRECGREYVVNASDAGASTCKIRGSKNNGIITLTFSDDGCGMNSKGVKDFFTVYRSGKDHPNSKAVGRHGIGKLSVAAIPSQCGFEMYTSDGKETCHAKTGSLLESTPIIINRLEPETTTGTTFKISFISSNTLKKEMEAYRDILLKYVAFLPMLIEVWIPETEDDESDQYPEVINRKWPGNGISFHRLYRKSIGGKEFSFVIGLGKSVNTLYQNNVMITSKYNLFSHGSNDSVIIPGLTILVDSPAFELPFGRHCLSNEDILPDITNMIRYRLVPNFYSEILMLYKIGDLKSFGVTNYEFELLTSALMYQDENIKSPWFNTPVFKCVNQRVVSFNELADSVAAGRYIFMADPKLSGVDFSVFNGPVLINEQTGYCAQILKKFFDSKMIDLNVESLVIEKPGNTRNDLTREEEEFERNLGFHPELLNKRKIDISGFGLENQGDSLDFGEKILNEKNISKEVQKANLELENIRWRVSKLVERDGVTPCVTHLYLFNNFTVILNLFNPVIKQLVQLTSVNPALAGHWAMAMCLLDEQNILPHITPETREDLLMLDAMVKANGSKTDFKGFEKGDTNPFLKLFSNFRNTELN